jgi:hypothetical protein
LINRSQGLVLGFFLCVIAALIAILAVEPDVYDSAISPVSRPSRGTEIGFLLSLSAFISLIGLGVIRRWRWLFWLILLAFLAGALRVPASALELLGVIPTGLPAWYTVFQALVGVAQFAIGLALLRGYRRAGVWGAF